MAWLDTMDTLLIIVTLDAGVFVFLRLAFFCASDVNFIALVLNNFSLNHSNDPRTLTEAGPLEEEAETEKDVRHGG